MKACIPILLLLVAYSALGQSYDYVYRNPADSTFNCYLKIHPTTTPIRGLIVRDFTSLPDTSQKSPYAFADLATQAGYLTLITNTSPIFPELYTAEAPMKLLDDIILEVIAAHNIPPENIFIGGISASGTRALRYAQYCAQGKSTIRIRGVFAVDSPLDLARFYASAYQHRQHFAEPMLQEANMMLPYFDRLFGGGPKQFYEAYKNASVFTHTDSAGGNAGHLTHTSILLFHEPDIDWWLEARGASYYDINSYDIAAFTLQLRHLGNPDVELITTTGQGFDRQGNRKCHSWTIVDEPYLMAWIVSRSK